MVTERTKKWDRQETEEVEVREDAQVRVFPLNAVSTRSDDKEMYFTNITKEVISIGRKLQWCTGVGVCVGPVFCLSRDRNAHRERHRQ